jgi:hypothetical protein
MLRLMRATDETEREVALIALTGLSPWAARGRGTGTARWSRAGAGIRDGGPFEVGGRQFAYAHALDRGDIDAAARTSRPPRSASTSCRRRRAHRCCSPPPRSTRSTTATPNAPAAARQAHDGPAQRAAPAAARAGRRAPGRRRRRRRSATRRVGAAAAAALAFDRGGAARWILRWRPHPHARIPAARLTRAFSAGTAARRSRRPAGCRTPRPAG